MNRKALTFLRPFARVLLVVAGYTVWIHARFLLADLFGFVDQSIPRSALTGVLSLLVLAPFWLPLPSVTGLVRARSGRIATCASAALFLPFVVFASRLGLAGGGISAEWMLYSLSLLLLAGSEEVFCRGFLLDALSLDRNRYVGLFLSSAVFAVLHMGNPHASVPGILNIFLAGGLFGLMRLVTRGLWYPILFHWLWNLMTGMVFGWSVSGYSQMPTLFRPAVAPPWGGFGPEESILMTIGTLGGIVILLMKLRSSDQDELARVEGIPGSKPQEVDT